MFGNKRNPEVDESWVNFLSSGEEYVLKPEKHAEEECDQPEVETKSKEEPNLFNPFATSDPVCTSSAEPHLFNPFAMSRPVCASSAGPNLFNPFAMSYPVFRSIAEPQQSSADLIASLWNMAEASNWKMFLKSLVCLHPEFFNKPAVSGRYQGKTLLLAAIENKQWKVANRLISLGAKIDNFYPVDLTAQIWHAAEAGKWEIVSILLEKIGNNAVCNVNFMDLSNTGRLCSLLDLAYNYPHQYVRYIRKVTDRLIQLGAKTSAEIMFSSSSFSMQPPLPNDLSKENTTSFQQEPLNKKIKTQQPQTAPLSFISQTSSLFGHSDNHFSPKEVEKSGSDEVNDLPPPLESVENVTQETVAAGQDLSLASAQIPEVKQPSLEEQNKLWTAYRPVMPESKKEWMSYFKEITKDVNKNNGTLNCSHCAFRVNQYLSNGFDPTLAAVPAENANVETYPTWGPGEKSVLRSYTLDPRVVALCPLGNKDSKDIVEDLTQDFRTIIEVEVNRETKQEDKVSYLKVQKNDLIQRLKENSPRRKKDGSAYGLIVLTTKNPKDTPRGHVINYFVTPNNDIFFIDAQQFDNDRKRVTTGLSLFMPRFLDDVFYINSIPPEGFVVKQELVGLPSSKGIKQEDGTQYRACFSVFTKPLSDNEREPLRQSHFQKGVGLHS